MKAKNILLAYFGPVKLFICRHRKTCFQFVFRCHWNCSIGSVHRFFFVFFFYKLFSLFSLDVKSFLLLFLFFVNGSKTWKQRSASKIGLEVPSLPLSKYLVINCSSTNTLFCFVSVSIVSCPIALSQYSNMLVQAITFTFFGQSCDRHCFSQQCLLSHSRNLPHHPLVCRHYLYLLLLFRAVAMWSHSYPVKFQFPLSFGRIHSEFTRICMRRFVFDLNEMLLIRLIRTDEIDIHLQLSS